MLQSLQLTKPLKILSIQNVILRPISFFRSSKKKKEESPHYVYMRATPDDTDSIIKLMKEAYYKEEPTYTSLNVQSPAVFLGGVQRSLSEGLTYVARCKYDNCIVGACINSTTNPWDADVKERFGCTLKDPDARKLFLFYAYIQRAADLYSCYNIQKVYEIEYLFVQQEHRFKGIARKLMEYSKLLGQDCGYKIIRCDATNEYTAMICEKLNMKKLFEVPYCSYVGQNMKPVFTPTPPHTACKVYISKCGQ